jgi:hypothetical protein
MKQKEQMGEMGSHLRTLLNFDITASTKKKAYYLDGEGQKPIKGIGRRPYTIPDQRTALEKLIESKFGEAAELSKRQLEAYEKLGSLYRVDHFLPQDVGSLAGFAISQPTHAASREQNWQLNPAIPPILQPGLGIPLFAPGFRTIGQQSQARPRR